MSSSTTEQTFLLGQIIIPDALETPLPLENTRVSAHILGPVAAVTVNQRFRNPLPENSELEYVFPLPHEAAITDFELQIGSRIIRAEIQEIKQARHTYDQARQQGQRAGLFEQRRPNLFSLQITNVQPGEYILTTIRYQEILNYQDDQYEFVFPMGITPKYHSPVHPEEAQGVDAPIAEDHSQVGPVEIELTIDAGVDLADPTSPSHPITISPREGKRLRVNLNGLHLPDHDFVLRYRVATDSPTIASWRVSGTDGDYFTTLLLPPIEGTSENPIPCEYIFVLDRSGSMTGEPIRQAINALRACLRSLNEQDIFYLLLFDDRLEWFDHKPSPVTEKTIDKADRYLSQVEGRGGTEIIPALQAALSLLPDSQRARYVIFLTDGAVSAEERALEKVHTLLGATHLFTFGIGPSVNRAFLLQLARWGGGTAEFLGLDEDIEGAILRFQDRIAYPILTNLTLQASNGNLWDVYPTHLPDLFAGQPVKITGRVKGSPKGVQLTLQGQRGGNKVVIHTSLATSSKGTEPNDQSTAEQLLGNLWARARLEELLTQIAIQPQNTHRLRAEAIGLALEHRLLTPFTAFVAVDSESLQSGQQPHLIRIAQPLPAGLDLFGFIGSSVQQPPMAFSPSPSVSAPPAMPRTASRSELSFDSVDTPAFLRSRIDRSHPSGRRTLHRFLSDNSQVDKDHIPEESSGDYDLTEASEAVANKHPEASLRWLARAQQLNGSWQLDVEMTAAALLALVRHGQTQSSSYLRKQLQRAYKWLIQYAGSGFATFLRALAFKELAAATGSQAHRQTAQQAVQSLPAPQTVLEKVAWGIIHEQSQLDPLPESATTPDDLRILVLRSAGVTVVVEELLENHEMLVRCLFAALL